MQSYLFAVNFNVCDVVLEHCGNIDLWKLVLAEHNEQTGLPAGSVSDDDQLFPDRCHGCRHGAHERPGLTSCRRSIHRAESTAAAPAAVATVGCAFKNVSGNK